MRIYDREGNYSRAEILAALEAAGSARREVTFHYSVLSATGAMLGDVTTSVLSCEVEHNAFGEVKRTAKITLRDDTSVNFLSDRIQPWMRLAMPKSTMPTPGDVVRRNLARDPGARSSSGTNWAGGASFAASRITDKRFPSGSAWVVALTANSSLPRGANGTANDIAVVSGEVYTFSIYALATVDRRFNIEVRFYNANNAIVGADLTMPAPVDVAADNVVRVFATGEVPATAVRAYVCARTEPGFGPGWTSGDRLLASSALVELGTALNPYYDGAAKNDSVLGGLAYEWEGATNASTSVARELVAGPDNRPGFVEWPLGVFLLSTPNRNLSPAGVITREVDGFDRTLELREDRLPARYTIAAGTGYTSAVGVLLAGRYDLRLTASTKTLPVAMEWEPGTSRLAILNDLLGAINYAGAYFDEDGALVCEPYLSPSERPPEYTYATDDRSMILPSIDQGVDLFEVPNDFVLVVSEADRPPLMARYTNSATNSPTSTANRGRTITDFRDGIEAADQATLDALAARIAFEASQVYETVDFETALMPIHGHADVYTLSVGGLVIGSKFSETSWKMELRAGGRMAHTVRRVVTV